MLNSRKQASLPNAILLNSPSASRKLNRFLENLTASMMHCLAVLRNAS